MSLSEIMAEIDRLYRHIEYMKDIAEAGYMEAGLPGMLDSFNSHWKRAINDALSRLKGYFDGAAGDDAGKIKRELSSLNYYDSDGNLPESILVLLMLVVSKRSVELCQMICEHHQLLALAAEGCYSKVISRLLWLILDQDGGKSMLDELLKYHSHVDPSYCYGVEGAAEASLLGAAFGYVDSTFQPTTEEAWGRPSKADRYLNSQLSALSLEALPVGESFKVEQVAMRLLKEVEVVCSAKEQALCLAMAVRMNCIQVVLHFLDNGFDVNASLGDGIFLDMRLLHFAARFRCYEMIEILLERGAQVDVLDSKNCTPLRYAVRFNPSGNEAAKKALALTIKKLLNKNADPNSTFNELGRRDGNDFGGISRVSSFRERVC